MKTTRRILSVVLAVMLAFSCVALTASAASGNNSDGTVLYEDSGKTSGYTYTLNIYSYLTTDSSSDVGTVIYPNANTTGNITTDNDVTSDTAVPGISYDIYYSSSYVTTKPASGLVGSVKTNSDGLAVFYTDTAGWYVCVPSDSQPSYVDTSVTPVTFTVYLPGTDGDGDTQNTVTVYPKLVVTGGLQFTKTWTPNAPSSSVVATFKLQSSTDGSTDWTDEYVSGGTNNVYSLSDASGGSATFTLTGDGTSTTQNVYINGLTVGKYYRIVETGVTDGTTEQAYQDTTGQTTTGQQVSYANYYTYGTDWAITGDSYHLTFEMTNTSSTSVSISKTVGEAVKSGDTYTDATNYSTSASISSIEGNAAEWKLEVNLSSDITSYTKLAIYDKFSASALTVIDGSWTVKCGDTTLTSGADNDYTISSSTANGYTLYKIALTATGISKLTNGGTLTITFKTTIADSAYCTYIPNMAFVSYTNGNGDSSDVDNQGSDPNTDDDNNGTSNKEEVGGDTDSPESYRDPEVPSSTSSDDPYAYTAKLVVTKYATGTTNAVEGAKYTLYKDQECSTVIGTETATDSSGQITWSGLKDGTYYLKETVAATDYTLDSTVYTITISGTTVATANLTTTTLVYDIPKTNLPLTGGTGLYLIVGLGLALVAVGGYFFFRKKSSAQ